MEYSIKELRMMKRASTYYYTGRATVIGTGKFVVLCFNDRKLEIRRYDNRLQAKDQECWNRESRGKKWSVTLDSLSELEKYR